MEDIRLRSCFKALVFIYGMIWGMCIQAFSYHAQWEHWCLYVCLIFTQEMKRLITLTYSAFGDSAVPLKLWSPKSCFTIGLLATGEPCYIYISRLTFSLLLHLKDYQAQIACWIFFKDQVWDLWNIQIGLGNIDL